MASGGTAFGGESSSRQAHRDGSTCAVHMSATAEQSLPPFAAIPGLMSDVGLSFFLAFRPPLSASTPPMVRFTADGPPDVLPPRCNLTITTRGYNGNLLLLPTMQPGPFGPHNCIRVRGSNKHRLTLHVANLLAEGDQSTLKYVNVLENLGQLPVQSKILVPEPLDLHLFLAVG